MRVQLSQPNLETPQSPLAMDQRTPQFHIVQRLFKWLWSGEALVSVWFCAGTARVNLKTIV